MYLINSRTPKALLKTFAFEWRLSESISKLLTDRATTLDRDQEEALCEILIRYFNKETWKLNTINSVQLLPADTGWGKTRVAVYAAMILKHLFKMETMIICPANIKYQWNEVMNQFNLNPVGIYSYEEIRGVKNRQECRHPFLIRGQGKDGDIFYMTEAWKKLLEKGVFLIIDESQKLKNDSDQHFACVELIYSLCQKEPATSKVLHLTASFIDKPGNWKNLMRCFGYTKRKEILEHRNNRKESHENYGIDEIKSVAYNLDREEARKIFREYNLNSRNIPVILNLLWVRVFRKYVVIPISDPVYVHPETKIPFKRSRYNAFYELDDEGRERADKAIRRLKQARVFGDDGYINFRVVNANFSLIQKSLMELCRAKLTTIVRLASEDLESHPTRKLVISIPFIDGQELVFEKLKIYNPLILNGNVKMDERPEIIDKFNEPNTDCRVLIMTPQVGGTGVSLHDTHGGFPRRMRLVPTYDFGASFQSAGRTYRRKLMSDVEIFIIYAANASLESILLNSLIKSKICNDVMIPGSNRVFPGNYDIFIENEHKYKDLRASLLRMKEKAELSLKKINK